MATIPHAQPSPRIVNGIIEWYDGDTFSLELELTLTDQSGESISIISTDKINVVFRKPDGTTVKNFEFTNQTSNTITLVFGTTETALFPKGEYLYDVWFTRDNRVTIANDNEVVVE